MNRARLVAVLAAAALTAGALTGCSSEPAAEAAGSGRVGVTEFASVLTKPGVQIIDVRTPEEFTEGHIQGATNIPVQQADFAQQVAQLDHNGVYAVYCRSGNRSKPAVAQMQAAGITTIYELAEGTKGWIGAGQPLIR